MTDRPRQDTDSPAMVDVSTAARLLGVTPDAVRSRLHRGTLAGEKVAGQWRVQLPPGETPETGTTGNRQGTTADQLDTDRPRQDAAAFDLSPLAEVVREQNRRIEELSATAAMWQARAMHLDERVKQLTAGDGDPGQPAGSRAWWHRADVLLGRGVNIGTVLLWIIGGAALITGLMSRDNLSLLMTVLIWTTIFANSVVTARADRALADRDLPRFHRLKELEKILAGVGVIIVVIWSQLPE